MDTRAQELPYPPHLYRAHTYGYPIPRFRDNMTEEFCDSFGSDMHTRFEEEVQSEIFGSISTPQDSLCTIGDLVKEIARHLRKTQINADQIRKGQDAWLSDMVSLSGDLLWTTHTVCQKGEMANKDQVAGLAIFETLKIKEVGVLLWRVKDLLDFFDSSPRFQSSRIDSFARTWAKNADEYLCWDFVPKEALLNFVPFENLAQREDETEDKLLRSVFLSSKNLRAYRKDVYPLETQTVDQYRNRISSFMMGVMDHVDCHVNADSFVNTMVGCFRDSSQWGYSLAPGGEDLEVMLRRVINAEYAWGVSHWRDSHCGFSCVCEKVFTDRLEAARAAIK